MEDPETHILDDDMFDIIFDKITGPAIGPKISEAKAILDLKPREIKEYIYDDTPEKEDFDAYIYEDTTEKEEYEYDNILEKEDFDIYINGNNTVY